MERELDSKDLRTVVLIVILGMIAVVTVLFWASRNISAQEKPKPRPATGITLHGCKSVMIYLSTGGGHILAPVWTDKTTIVPAANPLLCNHRGQVTFYVLPSQDYEIQEAK